MRILKNDMEYVDPKDSYEGADDEGEEDESET